MKFGKIFILVLNPEQDLTGVSQLFPWFAVLCGFPNWSHFAVPAEFHSNLCRNVIKPLLIGLRLLYKKNAKGIVFPDPF